MNKQESKRIRRYAKLNPLGKIIMALLNAINSLIQQLSSNDKTTDIIILIRAIDASQAKMNALVQARQQFGSSGGVTVISCKEA